MLNRKKRDLKPWEEAKERADRLRPKKLKITTRKKKKIVKLKGSTDMVRQIEFNFLSLQESMKQCKTFNELSTLHE